jgi:hypothetical protein
MDIQSLTAFFKWRTTINIAVFALLTIVILVFPDYIYSLHDKMFNLPREAFNIAVYSFLGLFELIILAFSFVPYVALRVVRSR